MNRDSNTELRPVDRAPIRPELLAAKLAAIHNYEYPELLEQIEARPRLVELLWFVQAMSLRPGGLRKFVEDLLAEFPDRIGTATMMKGKGKCYTLEEKVVIYNEIPSGYRPYIRQEGDSILAEILSDSNRKEVEEMKARDRKALESGLKDFDRERAIKICREAALVELPRYFAKLCTEKSLSFTGSFLTQNERDEQLAREPVAWSDDGFPKLRGGKADRSDPGDDWFFRDVTGALFEFMDCMAASVQKRLAMTEVVRIVFDHLDYALKEKVMVRIEGGSRFGKTESLSAWADMRPGLARLVRVPCDNSMNSFFKRIGEALGIDCSYGSNQSRLKEKVEYIIQHGGLFLVLDEGHFLVPQNYTATSAPNRLNWVRTEIVDRGLPLAIAVTPQSFTRALDRFVRKTGYDMTQFLGRQFISCVLPESLSEADLVAVARIHFTDLSENALGYIANEARLSENYLQAVEAVARRSRHLAGKRGGRVVVKDLETAVAEVLGRRTPEAVAQPIETDGADPVLETAAPTLARAHNRVINPPLKAPARALQSGRMQLAGAGTRPPISLRGARPGRAETDLVSAEA